jgi:hypothetical protein
MPTFPCNQQQSGNTEFHNYQKLQDFDWSDQWISEKAIRRAEEREDRKKRIARARISKGNNIQPEPRIVRYQKH